MENLVAMWDKLKSAYNGKRVFLTGHTGFKGAWLLKILSMLGADIRGYAKAPENENNLFNIIGGDRICDSIIADLRNKEKLTEAIISYKPDFVFHLAAQPLVRLSYQIPVETFEVNAIGTANLLEGLRQLKKQCYAILITTDKVYHNYERSRPYRESDRLGGYDPYSASKACAELIIDSYRNSFFNIKSFNAHQKAIAIARAGNVIGGGDWSMDRLIPDIVRALKNNEAVEIRNPEAIRPWQHVLEPLLGYLLLGVKLTDDVQLFSQAYNFGPDVNDILSVGEMTEMAISSWGSGEYFINKIFNQPHEAGLLKLDISKAMAELEWRPKFSAGAAVEYTIDWYKKFYFENESINKFTEYQIFNFVQ